LPTRPASPADLLRPDAATAEAAAAGYREVARRAVRETLPLELPCEQLNAPIGDCFDEGGIAGRRASAPRLDLAERLLELGNRRGGARGVDGCLCRQRLAVAGEQRAGSLRMGFANISYSFLFTRSLARGG
jgi:hypothetical protein